MRGLIVKNALMSLYFIILQNAFSAPIERVLPVTVNIVTNQVSSDLEIVADKSAFLVIYNSKSQQFLPLDIPFKVRSVSGASLAYSLRLSQLGGICDGIEPLTPTPALDGISATLNESYQFIGMENSHLLTLSFPSLYQTNLTQNCEGYVGVIAELTV
ncbi:hypothetical protein [Aeromonas hydrophila]|uniref:hypothetical protein n=1 Tax=Aeromonas hydrophila TaxID=644 RepID=UPI0012699AE8|nr:hypothetical protein [Aeromonas hydrophila]